MNLMIQRIMIHAQLLLNKIKCIFMVEKHVKVLFSSNTNSQSEFVNITKDCKHKQQSDE